MTDKQKRFKILNRESYEAQISQESKNASTRALLFGLYAAFAVNGFFQSYNVNSPDILQALNYPAAIASCVISGHQFKKLVEAISRKTMLESKIKDIDMELAMDEIEENRGFRK